MTVVGKDRPAGHPPGTATDAHTWQPLRYFNLYRLLLSGLFSTLYFSGTGPRLLGETHPQLFPAVSLIYLACVLASGFAHRWRRPAFRRQVRVNMLVDIVAITLLMHASGGVSSGLGMLLLVTLAGGALLMPGRSILMFAATASLAVLGEQVYSHLTSNLDTTAYTQTGILGATFFAAALVANVLAGRVRATEALAAQRGVDLANMEQLNAYIIQHLQSGILVVDGAERVRLMNESAWYLLGMPTANEQYHLARVSPTLAAHLRDWRVHQNAEPPPFRVSPNGSDLQARFTRLGSGNDAGTVIFLEDTAALAQQVQQMKLASLGRLTASIAHEIRNPLGAISHAGQLLRESPALPHSERRLTEIIHGQSQRVNTIIENVLQLSRRERSRPEVFDLLPWLREFGAEFCRDWHIAGECLTVEIQPADVQVHMDPSHLRQVLWNLCENALRHGTPDAATPHVELRGGLSAETGGPVLDVIDQGPGISPATAQQIFEPFFTTDRTGTGLGLYIARELCEFNQAQLRHVPIPSGGCCFRISFADPRRQVL